MWTMKLSASEAEKEEIESKEKDLDGAFRIRKCLNKIKKDLRMTIMAKRMQSGGLEDDDVGLIGYNPHDLNSAEVGLILKFNVNLL